MSQEWQTYFSADSQMTTLNGDLTSNTTDLGLVSTYANARATLFSAVATAEATALATPNSTNLNALVTAITNRDTQIAGNSFAAMVADRAVNGSGQADGTIMVRTVPDIISALTDAIAKVNAAIVAIGYGTGVTVANAALRDRLAAQVAVAQTLLSGSSSWKRPGDMTGALNWLGAGTGAYILYPN